MKGRNFMKKLLIPSLIQKRNFADKICLIIPPSLFLLDERVFMSLGILKVAAVLEQAGISVEVLDLSGIKNFSEVVSDYAKVRKDVYYFGLTSTTPQLPAATKIVKAIRNAHHNAKIILGGPHITLVNAAHKRENKLGVKGRAVEAIKHLTNLFDVLIAGDGEEAIFLALDKNASNLIDADDKNSPLFLSNQRLNELPFPARHLIEIDSYHYYIDGTLALSLIAQLGCPFGCGFCGGRESPMLRKIRMRTIENIVEEMVHLYKTTGIRGFMLYDDELNVNKNMVSLMNSIAKAQKDLGVEWKLRGFIKSELFTDEQAMAMYKAGFRWILTGFESGSSQILRVMNKKATIEENTRCVNIAKRHGLKVKALMSIGHPGETLDTISETKKWIIAVKPEDFDVTIITCYPGTPYYDIAVSDKNRKGVWVYTCPKTQDKLYQIEVDYTVTSDYYKGNPDGGYCAYVFTDTLSPEVLAKERDKLEREVRTTLDIPFNKFAQTVLYEHSMGQCGKFPKNILKKSTI